ADAARRALLAGAARLASAEEEVRADSGSGLALTGRWIARLRARQQELAGDAARCGRESEASSALEEARREELSAAELELKAVSRHRERWESERRRTAQAAEEAEQDDRAPATAAGQRPT
ncbi:MAG: hypothetical protein WCC48_13770, partial [Anaeromyxobacteraceae bacterium]